MLTANPRAYEDASSDLLREVPNDIGVCRAFALNTARHLALGGRYPAILAVPDRWVSWLIGGIVAGLASDRPT